MRYVVRDARSPHFPIRERLQNPFGLGFLYALSSVAAPPHVATSSRRPCVKETNEQLTRREEIERAMGFGDVQEAQRNVGDGCDRVSRLQRGILGTRSLGKPGFITSEEFFVALCRPFVST